MTTSTISALTAASALTGAELFEVVQGGNSRKATASQIVSAYGTSVKTANYTGTANDCYVAVDTSGGALTLTFPPAPVNNQRFGTILTGAGNDLIINGNGKDVFDILNTSAMQPVWTWVGANQAVGESILWGFSSALNGWTCFGGL